MATNTIAGTRVKYQREARHEAIGLGHRLYPTWMGDARIGENRCRDCGARLVVTVLSANSVVISGAAYTMTCPTKR